MATCLAVVPLAACNVSGGCWDAGMLGCWWHDFPKTLASSMENHEFNICWKVKSSRNRPLFCCVLNYQKACHFFWGKLLGTFSMRTLAQWWSNIYFRSRNFFCPLIFGSSLTTFFSRSTHALWNINIPCRIKDMLNPETHTSIQEKKHLPICEKTIVFFSAFCSLFCSRRRGLFPAKQTQF